MALSWTRLVDSKWVGRRKKEGKGWSLRRKSVMSKERRTEGVEGGAGG